MATAPGDSFVYVQSIMGTTPVPLVNATVTVANNAATAGACAPDNCLTLDEYLESSNCTGTYQAPTAPPGRLCIYPFNLNNVESKSLIANTAPPNDDALTTNRIPGFYVEWRSARPDYTSFGATWAYTAP